MSAAEDRDEQKTTRAFVYQFGLLPPVEGAAEIRTQLRAAHELKRDLTMLRWARRDRQREVETTAEIQAIRDQRDAIQAEIDGLESEITAGRQARNAAIRDGMPKADRKRAGSPRSEASPEQKAQIKRLRDEKKTLSWQERAAIRALREAHPEARDEVKARMNELQGLFNRSRKDIRFDTKSLVADACFAADKKMPLWSEGRPSNPRLPRFDGSGHVSVQVMHQKDGVRGPATVRELFSPNAEAWIDPVATWCKKNRMGVDRRKLPLLHLRIGAKDGSVHQQWASFPIILHRELPREAKIKRITVSVAKVGPRERWTCEMTLEVPSGWASESCGPAGAIAVRLGWSRARDGAIVVGQWLDTDGKSGEVRIDSKLADRLTYPSELRRIRDRHFDSARDSLASWIKANEVPEWMRERAKWISHWKAPRKLAALVSFWSRNRFAGDDEAFGARGEYRPEGDRSVCIREGTGAEGWRYHDYHLWEWQESQRGKAIGARREIMNRFAAAAVRSHAEVVVDDADLSKLARRPRAEDDGANLVANALRQLAAPGELREAVKKAATMRGAKVTTVSSVGIASECHSCRAEIPGQKDEPVLVCLACGHEDARADLVLANMLHRAGHSVAVESILKNRRKAIGLLKGTPHVEEDHQVAAEEE